jgi:MFS family permease
VYDPEELTTRQSIGHVLRTHPEGKSLFGEAGHYRVLAEQSAAEVARVFTGMQETRFSCDELRRRLDPRRTRTIHLGVGLTLLAVIFTILVPLDAIELSGVLAGWMTAAAAAAAAAWIGCSWLAALAKREGQSGLLTAIIVSAMGVGLLLAALHGLGAATRQADVWHRFGIGVLLVLLIFALVAIAAVLIARTEPASLLSARRRWHRARDEYVAAVQTHRSDVEAAVIAEQGWRSLIEVQANASADGEEQAGMATHQP